MLARKIREWEVGNITVLHCTFYIVPTLCMILLLPQTQLKNDHNKGNFFSWSRNSEKCFPKHKNFALTDDTDVENIHV